MMMLQFGASFSYVPRLEVDPGIDPGVGEIGEQVDDEAQQREDIEIAEHDRIVALNQGIIGEIAEPIEATNKTRKIQNDQ